MIYFIFAATLITWAGFVVAMRLSRLSDRFAPTFFNKFFVGLAYVGDAFYNITVGSILFMQIPKQWLFTQRCIDNLTNKVKWRRGLSNKICNALDVVDPSKNHCRRKNV